MSAIDDVVGAAERLERNDVVDALRAAKARAVRPETFVVVMGEFKQGKSSLVNALVGRAVCPTDDDTATAIVTLVKPATCDGVTVTRDGHTDAISIGDARSVICASDGAPPAEQVLFSVANANVAAGLVVVDTPGVGGLDGGHTLAALAFLPHADAAIFVSDATAELSAAELLWLDRIRDAGPAIYPVLTKTDLAPAWRRIAELDRDHLERHGIQARISTTSAALHQIAADIGDEQLDEDSGILALRRLLVSDVADPARQRAEQRSRRTARRLARVLAEQLRAETELLGANAAQLAAEVESTHSRLEHLRGPGSKWQQRLADRTADITNSSTFGFRASMRTIGQSIDVRVDELESPADWAGYTDELQGELADAVRATFVAIDAELDQLRRDLFDLVAVEVATVAHAVDWSSLIEFAEGAATSGAQAVGSPGKAMTAARGAQSGLMLFGFLGQLLPAAAGALLLSSPITLVLGGAFAGKALLDVRKRSLTVRRSQLKVAARKVLDDAQFDLGNRVAEYVRTATRELRDEVAEAVSLAMRSGTDALANAKELVHRSESERVDRRSELREIATILRAADAALNELS